MDTEERIDDKVRAERAQKLAAIGLADIAPRLSPNPWKFDPCEIILGMDGKAVIGGNRWGDHIRDAASRLLERDIRVEDFQRGDAALHYFVCAHSLTVPERCAFETLVRYFDNYYPGIEAASEYVTFPAALHAIGAPIAFESELDAYEAADVLETVAGMPAEVVAADGGFGVVVHDDRGDLTDYNYALVAGACAVLEHFSVARKNKELFEIWDYARGAESWQKAVGGRYTQQARIEAKIDRVLALLEGDPVVVAKCAEMGGAA